MIETSVKEDFLDLFYHDIKNQSLSHSNTLNTFVLKITNNRFAYKELSKVLGNKLHHFALSRKEVTRLKEADKLRCLTDRAREKLRNYKSNEGELGEILLYCLLESHLNAPKILTKLELKNL